MSTITKAARCTGTAVASARARPARRCQALPQRARAAAPTTSSAERHAEFDRAGAGQVVRVVEERDRPAGERRQRPGEVELAEADAEPRMRARSAQRVRPDGEARAREVAARRSAPGAPNACSAARGPAAVPGPGERSTGTAPAARSTRVARDRRRSSRPQPASVSMPRAPVREPVSTTTRGTAAPARTRPDGGDRAGLLRARATATMRPQQQAAQVVGLAQVAGSAAGIAGQRDPVAVGELRREHLDQADRAARDAGQHQRDAERAGTRRSASPARWTQAPMATTSKAPGRSRPSTGPAARAARPRTARPARSGSRAPVPPGERARRRRRRASRARAMARASRNAPQPTYAATWLKKVAEGATLNAMQRRQPNCSASGDKPRAREECLGGVKIIENHARLSHGSPGACGAGRDRTLRGARTGNGAAASCGNVP